VVTIALAVLGSLRTFRERVRMNDAIARIRVDMNLLP
jgi:hypothetical protein